MRSAYKTSEAVLLSMLVANNHISREHNQENNCDTFILKNRKSRCHKIGKNPNVNINKGNEKRRN